MSKTASLNFNTQFAPKIGYPEPIFENVRRIVAPNASPYTFTGTNTYIVGDTDTVIIDPGPDDSKHLQTILNAVGGSSVSAIALTHTHKDHSSLARRLSDALGDAPIVFAGQHRLSRPKRPLEINLLHGSADWDLKPHQVLADGDTLDAGNVQLEVITTPGHCANHISLAIKGTSLVLTGDHVMGWNSTLVGTPDGSMSDYLSSLDKLIERDILKTYLPAHGPVIENGHAFARALKGHRLHRNQQILNLISSRPQTVWRLTKKMYPRAASKILRAAAMTVQAHLEHLHESKKLDYRWLPLFGGFVRTLA